MRRKNNTEPLSIWEHLAELRTYAFVSISVLIVGALITHHYHQQLIRIILAPLQSQQLIFLSPLDPLLFIFKVDFYGGFILALPVILFCIFRFIAPAVNGRNNLYIGIFLMCSIILVIAAALYTYLLLLPLCMKFLLSIQVAGIQNMFTAQQYLGFAFMQLLLTVLIFQIPCIVALLTLAGLLNPILLSKNRPIAYITATIALSFLTPTTDLYTLSLVLLPTLFIFEISIVIGRVIYFMRRRDKTYYGEETYA